MVTVPAYTKINLSLEVTGRRDDGFHSIVSVMQMVDLHDILHFEAAPDLSFDSDDPSMVAEGEGNLVVRAVHLLRGRYGVQGQGAHIMLEKRIPASAGLGGGSSDAATTLLGLSRLWGLDVEKAALGELGAELGSDVPFFLGGPTAFADERGERVVTIHAPRPFCAVLVCQPYNLPEKTKRLYASLLPSDMTDGSLTRSLVEHLSKGAAIPDLPLHNTFERAAMEIFGGLAVVRQQMLDAGAPSVHLSGSGPTLYSLFPAAQSERAQSTLERLLGAGLRSFCVRGLTSVEPAVPAEG